jgi:TetR/AcrR family transcriptional repressor of nem operon
MGRSTAEQAAQNRVKIVEGASRLFRARGVENVSVAEVMASVGMTNGGFYKHFESKDALVQEACKFSFEQALSSWLAMAKEERGDPGSKAKAIVRYYFKACPADRTCPMLAYAPNVSAEDTSGSTRETYSRGAQALFELFTDKPSETTESGTPDSEAEQNAQVMFAAMVGAKLLEQATQGSNGQNCCSKL